MIKNAETRYISCNVWSQSNCNVKWN